MRAIQQKQRADTKVYTWLGRLSPEASRELSICARICTLRRMLCSFPSELAEENGTLGEKETGSFWRKHRETRSETRGRERTVASVESSTASICGTKTAHIQPREIGFTI
jgi:hypothetical protein